MKNINTQFLINSIFRATEGEGIHLGTPQIFVRFQGCRIACQNCDSKETWSFDPAYNRTEEEVLSAIEKLSLTDLPASSQPPFKTLKGRPLKRISITGGDPLHPQNEAAVLKLVQLLKSQGYYINIEASGARIVDEIFEAVDFISYDFKTPSTGVRTPLEKLILLTRHYPGKFQIKSVIANEKDFWATWEAYLIVEREYPPMDFFWCLTPAYTPGEDFDNNNFINIFHLNESLGGPFRVIGQQHKWIYGVDAKDV